jgi:hypothetical protein
MVAHAAGWGHAFRGLDHAGRDVLVRASPVRVGHLVPGGAAPASPLA